MARVNEKLHSRRGASILIAMILLLVASMVSIVIISASLTATHRAKSEREYTQKTLYVQSAAELLKACLKNTAVTVSQTVTEYEGEEPAVGAVEYSGSGVLGEIMRAAVQEAEALDPERDQTKTEEKTVTIAAHGDVPDATVTFRMYNEDNKDSAGNVVRFADAETADRPSYPYTIIGTVALDGESGVKMYFTAYATGQYTSSTTDASKSGDGDEVIEGTRTVRTLTMSGWDASLYTFASAREGG